MSRPLMSAVAAQQAVVDSLRAQLDQANRKLAVQDRQIAMIARLAGISDEIAKVADINNPAQPVPDPGEQAATETTEQAVTPETNDDVRSPGQTGGSTDHVPAAATDTPINPGGTLPTQPYTNLVDVTAPTQGTNTGEVSPDQMRIETDVRHLPPGPAGQMNPEVAFPWNITPNQSNTAPPHDGEMAGGKAASLDPAARFAATLRLARLRVSAGLATGEDLAIAANLQADASLTDEMIAHEIRTLDAVVKASAQNTPRGETIPRRTTAKTRTAPSLASAPTPLGNANASGMDDAMLFIGADDLAGL